MNLWLMFQFLALLLLPPMLIEFCILRRGFKSVPYSILISAFLNALLWVGLWIACNWGIETIAESGQTNDHFFARMIFCIVLFFLATTVSIIPAALFGIIYSKLRRARHEPAA